MNIFFLDVNIEKSAQYHCDKHCIKLILETTQMACTAHHLNCRWELPEKFYRSTHVNHPMSKWVRECSSNYITCVKYADQLANEYTYRYGKIHASTPIIDWLYGHIPNIPLKGLTSPPQCMPDEYKIPYDLIGAYRKYYKEDKLVNIDCRWTRREMPEWLKK